MFVKTDFDLPIIFLVPESQSFAGEDFEGLKVWLLFVKKALLGDG